MSSLWRLLPLNSTQSQAPDRSGASHEKNLKSTEWILVFSFLLIFASLFLVAKINVYQARKTLKEQFEPVEPFLVTIEGAVGKPGVYSALPGVDLGQILKKARPKMHADLRGIDLKQEIKSPLTLHIEELKEISVIIQGAVDRPQEVLLPVRARICDLKSKISYTQAADLSFFKGRRQIKNGEIIEIPKKSVE